MNDRHQALEDRLTKNGGLTKLIDTVTKEPITPEVVNTACNGITVPEVKTECFKALCPWADGKETWKTAVDKHAHNDEPPLKGKDKC